MSIVDALRKAAGVLLITASSACLTNARADTIYTFKGDCADCNNAVGTLDLGNYVPLTPISFSRDFVSFSYSSSVYPSGLSADHSGASFFFTGPNGLPDATTILGGHVDFGIQFLDATTEQTYLFLTLADGTWYLRKLDAPPPPPPPGHGGGGGGGDSTAQDYGSSYTFQLEGPATSVPSTLPLPASAHLFGATLLALGAVGYGLKRRGSATA